MESYESRRHIVKDSTSQGYMVLKSTDQGSYNRHEFRPNNYFFYLTGYSEAGELFDSDRDGKHPFTLSLPN